MSALHDETSIPLEQRVLVLEGLLAQEAFNAIQNGLPAAATAARCGFTRYTYATIPLPKTYDVVFDYNDPARYEHIPVTIKAATQQFSFPDPTLPHGWKMICWFDESIGTSQLLGRLPQVSAWGNDELVVGLCSFETHAERMKSIKA